MKVVFTTSGMDLDSPLHSSFGRSPALLVYDMDKDVYEVVDNRPGLHAQQGAGVQTAETVSRAGAECVVTGHCGPKAFAVLSAAGIKVYTAEVSTVRVALEGFRAGRLAALSTPDVESHWA